MANVGLGAQSSEDEMPREDEMPSEDETPAEDETSGSRPLCARAGAGPPDHLPRTRLAVRARCVPGLGLGRLPIC